jgi:hypothetical protein
VGAALLIVAACSGKPRPEEAHGVPAPGDAGPAAGDAGSAGDAGPAAGDAGSGAAAARGRGTTGDLQIRVEWPNVPVAARRSPGRTPCHTPRTPSVAPTTTWGIPDALVIVDGAGPPLAAAHVTLADCTLAPRLAVGASLAITSAADRPAKLVLRKRGAAADLAHLTDGAPVPVLLPIAGHTVTAALEPGAIYALETDDAVRAPPTDAGPGDAAPEVAFIAAVPGGYVTEASGQVTARGLAPGAHAVTAWLPPRAGQPGRSGRGTVTIVAGDLAELTITLAP